MAKTPFKLKSGNKPAFKTMGSSPNKILGLFKSKDEEELTPEQAKAKDEKKKATKKKIVATGVGALTGAMDAVYGSGKVLPGEKKKKEDDDEDKTDDENGENGENGENENNSSVGGTSTVSTEGVDKIINEE